MGAVEGAAVVNGVPKIEGIGGKTMFNEGAGVPEAIKKGKEMISAKSCWSSSTRPFSADTLAVQAPARTYSEPTTIRSTLLALSRVHDEAWSVWHNPDLLGKVWVKINRRNVVLVGLVNGLSAYKCSEGRSGRGYPIPGY